MDTEQTEKTPSRIATLARKASPKRVITQIAANREAKQEKEEFLDALFETRRIPKKTPNQK